MDAAREVNNNQRQINKDLQELVHLATAAKSILNVMGIRIDDIIIRAENRKRNGDKKNEIKIPRNEYERLKKLVNKKGDI